MKQYQGQRNIMFNPHFPPWGAAMAANQGTGSPGPQHGIVRSNIRQEGQQANVALSGDGSDAAGLQEQQMYQHAQQTPRSAAGGTLVKVCNHCVWQNFSWSAD